MDPAPSWLDRRPNKIAVGLGLFVIVIVIRTASQADGPAVPVAAPTTSEALLEAAPTPLPSASPAPPDADDGVSRAVADAERTMAALGASGASLYSSNCYAGLEAKFAEPTLVRCLAFDLVASRMIGPDDVSATLHFAEQTVRARFDSAALAGNLAAGHGAALFTDTLAAVAARSAPLAAPPAPVTEPEGENSDEGENEAVPEAAPEDLVPPEFDRRSDEALD